MQSLTQTLQRGRRGATALSWILYLTSAAGIVSNLLGVAYSFDSPTCGSASAVPLFVAIYALAALVASVWGISDGHKRNGGAWLISQTTLSKSVLLILFAGVALGATLFARAACTTVPTVATTSAVTVAVSAAALLTLFILLNGDFVRGMPILLQNAPLQTRLERVAPRRGISSYSFGLWMTVGVIVLGIVALILGLLALDTPTSAAVACAALFVTMAAIWQTVVGIYAAATATPAFNAWMASRATTPLAITAAAVTGVAFAFTLYAAALTATTGSEEGLLIAAAVVLGLSLIGLIWLIVRLLRTVYTYSMLRGGALGGVPPP